MLRLISTARDVALTVYDVVKNTDNAFLTVFMHLTGAGVGRTGFKNAGNARRGMSSKAYDSLGNVKVKLDKVSSIREDVCKF